jgi:transcriptional regulator with XRE-family HTH domain
MDTLVDSAEAAIARRILLERTSRGWSLADLADKSGVAKASISKIERGEVSPSAGILVRLATAFDLTLAGLLLRAEETGRFFRSPDQPRWRDPKTGYVRRQIFRAPDHPLELIEVEMPPGKKVDFAASTYVNMRHVLWVEEGELVLREGGERHVLKAGDSLGFGPPSDVTYANESKKPCRYLLALTRS